VVNLDADDWLLPGYFTAADSAFDLGADSFFCSLYRYEQAGNRYDLRQLSATGMMLDAAKLRGRLLRNFFVRTTGAAWRSQLSEAVSPPHPTIWHDDWEYFLRLTRGQSAFITAEPLGVYRVHPSSISARSRDRTPDVQKRVTDLLELVRVKDTEAYQTPDERSRFAMGLAESYLRTVGRSLGLRNGAQALSHFGFAMRLAGSERPQLALGAAGLGLRLTLEALRDRPGAVRGPAPTKGTNAS
jgi:hypothetical protein